MVSAQTCPVCNKSLPPAGVDPALLPFCSPRCRQVDLYRWVTGRYSIVEPLDPEHLARELEAGDTEVGDPEECDEG
jgi:endogenous inhibitor of DNA gyrase (YacG/DUF329 family)